MPTKQILKRKTSFDATSDSNDDSANKHYKEGDEELDDDHSSDGSRKKKARTTFTGRQIFELEKQFEVKKYLSSSERTEMAKLLNVTETQVSKKAKYNKIFRKFKLTSFTINEYGNIILLQGIIEYMLCTLFILSLFAFNSSKKNISKLQG